MSNRAADLRRRLEERMAALSPEQRARLDTAAPATHGSAEPAIGPRPPGTVAPLTHAQELLWLLDRSSPELSAYNVPGVYRLEGRLDLDALQHALDTLVERHEILRTAFVASEAGPAQEVRPPRKVPVEVADLRHLPVDQRELRASERVRAVTTAPMALDAGLLLKATVIRIADQDQVLVLMTHHIASDGWSMRVLERELAALYDGFVSGRPVDLPSPGIQFADYAVWERNRLSGQRLTELLSYWRVQLQDAPTQIDIPTDRPRPTLPRFDGARRIRALDPLIATLLAERAGELGASRFMILLAGFHALLARWTELEDIVVAIPMAERRRSELEGMIGYVVNTLPIRARPLSRIGFAQLVDEVRQACLGADEHSEIPFEMLAAQSRAAGNAMQLQTIFSVGGADGGVPLRLSGLMLKPMSFERGWAKFELGLSVVDRPTGQHALLEYRTDLFDEATADRWLELYERLLLEALRAPEVPLGTLPLLSEAEWHRIVVEWNATDTPVPPDALVHELIAERARMAPDAVALTSGSARSTYAEMEARAEQIARHLRRLGVAPEVPVGICLEATLDFPAVLLGVYKAGGACVPLDPAYPADRLTFMIEDTGMPVILTTEALARDLPAGKARLVLLDRDHAEIGAKLPDPAPIRTSPDGTAYILYTSGSTGRPRGVLLTHRGLVNQHLAVAGIYQLTAADRVPQLASLSFDVAVEEIFATLVAGGTVALRPPGVPLVGAGFHAWLTEQGVTVVEMATAHWHEWANDVATSRLPIPATVRVVSVGGEKAEVAVYRRWLEMVPASVRLLNGYGPTEATVDVTFWEFSEHGFGSEGVPIGRPMANVRAYVLDTAQRPVPIGFAGELCIGGVQLARGYLNQPEQTAAKFLPDPFRPGTPDRIYRTGDRARFRADGNIEYLGRVDHQVKLNGFRIELGEVESAVADCAGVSAAAAVIREDRPGQRRLVAYFAPLAGVTLDPNAVRIALRERLPGYMMPSRLVLLPSLPMSPNGKIERKALPVPEEGDGAPTRTPPGSELERAIALVWSEVLGVGEVGVEDDLFELGGHSLLVMRIASRLRQQHGVPVTLPEILSRPTVRQLAEFIGAAQRPSAPTAGASLLSVAQRRSAVPGGGER